MQGSLKFMSFNDMGFLFMKTIGIKTHVNCTRLLSNYCTFGGQITTIKHYMGLETNFSLPQDSCCFPWVSIQYLVHFSLCQLLHLDACAAKLWLHESLQECTCPSARRNNPVMHFSVNTNPPYLECLMGLADYLCISITWGYVLLSLLSWSHHPICQLHQNG